MRNFSLTTFNRASSEVLDAAHREPVGLTQRGKTKFVIMAADHYERMFKPSAQRAVDINNASQQELDELRADLDVE